MSTATSPTTRLDSWVAFLRSHSAITRQLNADLLAAHGLTLNDYEVLLHLSRAENMKMRRVDLAHLTPIVVWTGFSIALPPGFEAQIRPRSGLALRHGVTCLNTPGTIDADYRGPVQVLLANLGAEPVVIRRGDRIAQMVVAPVSRAAFEEVDDLSQTSRGEGGFGSTGVASGAATVVTT